MSTVAGFQRTGSSAPVSKKKTDLIALIMSGAGGNDEDIINAYFLRAELEAHLTTSPSKSDVMLLQRCKAAYDIMCSVARTASGDTLKLGWALLQTETQFALGANDASFIPPLGNWMAVLLKEVKVAGATRWNYAKIRDFLSLGWPDEQSTRRALPASELGPCQWWYGFEGQNGGVLTRAVLRQRIIDHLRRSSSGRTRTNAAQRADSPVGNAGPQAPGEENTRESDGRPTRLAADASRAALQNATVVDDRRDGDYVPGTGEVVTTRAAQLTSRANSEAPSPHLAAAGRTRRAEGSGSHGSPWLRPGQFRGDVTFKVTDYDAHERYLRSLPRGTIQDLDLWELPEMHGISRRRPREVFLFEKTCDKCAILGCACIYRGNASCLNCYWIKHKCTGGKTPNAQHPLVKGFKPDLSLRLQLLNSLEADGVMEFPAFLERNGRLAASGTGGTGRPQAYSPPAPPYNAPYTAPPPVTPPPATANELPPAPLIPDMGGPAAAVPAQPGQGASTGGVSVAPQGTVQQGTSAPAIPGGTSDMVTGPPSASVYTFPEPVAAVTRPSVEVNRAPLTTAARSPVPVMNTTTTAPEADSLVTVDAAVAANAADSPGPVDTLTVETATVPTVSLPVANTGVSAPWVDGNAPVVQYNGTTSATPTTATGRTAETSGGETAPIIAPDTQRHYNTPAVIPSSQLAKSNAAATLPIAVNNKRPAGSNEDVAPQDTSRKGLVPKKKRHQQAPTMSRSASATSHDGRQSPALSGQRTQPMGVASAQQVPGGGLLDAVPSRDQTSTPTEPGNVNSPASTIATLPKDKGKGRAPPPPLASRRPEPPLRFTTPPPGSRPVPRAGTDRTYPVGIRPVLPDPDMRVEGGLTRISHPHPWLPPPGAGVFNPGGDLFLVSHLERSYLDHSRENRELMRDWMTGRYLTEHLVPQVSSKIVDAQAPDRQTLRDLLAGQQRLLSSQERTNERLRALEDRQAPTADITTSSSRVAVPVTSGNQSEQPVSVGAMQVMFQELKVQMGGMKETMLRDLQAETRPLTARVDGLSGIVDGFSGRLEALEGRFNSAPVNSLHSATRAGEHPAGTNPPSRASSQSRHPSAANESHPMALEAPSRSSPPVSGDCANRSSPALFGQSTPQHERPGMLPLQTALVSVSDPANAVAGSAHTSSSSHRSTSATPTPAVLGTPALHGLQRGPRFPSSRAASSSREGSTSRALASQPVLSAPGRRSGFPSPMSPLTSGGSHAGSAAGASDSDEEIEDAEAFQGRKRDSHAAALAQPPAPKRARSRPISSSDADGEGETDDADEATLVGMEPMEVDGAPTPSISRRRRPHGPPTRRQPVRSTVRDATRV